MSAQRIRPNRRYWQRLHLRAMRCLGMGSEGLVVWYRHPFGIVSHDLSTYRWALHSFRPGGRRALRKMVGQPAPSVVVNLIGKYSEPVSVVISLKIN